jgi:hypothetical protein
MAFPFQFLNRRKRMLLIVSAHEEEGEHDVGRELMFEGSCAVSPGSQLCRVQGARFCGGCSSGARDAATGCLSLVKLLAELTNNTSDGRQKSLIVKAVDVVGEDNFSLSSIRECAPCLCIFHYYSDEN